MKLYESTGLSSVFLAEIYSSVPEVSVSSTTAQLDKIEFSSAEIIRHSHAGVGSGNIRILLSCVSKTLFHNSSASFTCILLNNGL